MATTLTGAVREEVRAIPAGQPFTLEDVNRIWRELRNSYPSVKNSHNPRCMLERERDNHGLIYLDNHGKYVCGR